MITFLPSPDFKECAKILDRQRLNRQRTEAKWVLDIVIRERDYINCPLVRMWEGYESALVHYGIAICEEWISRGYKDRQLEYFTKILYKCRFKIDNYQKPSWLGNKLLHSSHRSKLITKNPIHYSQFGWIEKPDPLVNYWWP